MTGSSNRNEWVKAEHALQYLARAEEIPHRTEGEAVLLDFVPVDTRRILDVGSGDGRLLALLSADRPDTEAVALDVSETMLCAASERFHDDTNVELVRHDFDSPLPELGQFDAIVSSFAIHHVSDERKKQIYCEIHAALSPGGVFCNLEHVASVSVELHRRFLAKLGTSEAEEDPSNQLAPLETQLQWLREIGFWDVDCHWKWLELALLVGSKES